MATTPSTASTPETDAAVAALLDALPLDQWIAARHALDHTIAHKVAALPPMTCACPTPTLYEVAEDTLWQTVTIHGEDAIVNQTDSATGYETVTFACGVCHRPVLPGDYVFDWR